MPRYSKQKNLRLSEEQWDEMKQAVEAGEYTNDSTYLRAMIEAGKSNIAALDPRTGDTETQSQTTHENTSEAAMSVSDSVLIDALDAGEANKQLIDEVLEKPTNEFESQLATRLDRLADEPSSPVKSDRSGRTAQLKYWVEGDG